MHYVFELCPKCKNELVEKDMEEFQEYIPGTCSNCGNEMEGVLWGDKKVENAIYKITLNKVQNMDKGEMSENHNESRRLGQKCRMAEDEYPRQHYF